MALSDSSSSSGSSSTSEDSGVIRKQPVSPEQPPEPTLSKNMADYIKNVSSQQLEIGSGSENSAPSRMSTSNEGSESQSSHSRPSNRDDDRRSSSSRSSQDTMEEVKGLLEPAIPIAEAKSPSSSGSSHESSVKARQAIAASNLSDSSEGSPTDGSASQSRSSVSESQSRSSEKRSGGSGSQSENKAIDNSEGEAESRSEQSQSTSSEKRSGGSGSQSENKAIDNSEGEAESQSENDSEQPSQSKSLNVDVSKSPNKTGEAQVKLSSGSKKEGSHEDSLEDSLQSNPAASPSVKGNDDRETSKGSLKFVSESNEDTTRLTSMTSKTSDRSDSSHESPASKLESGISEPNHEKSTENNGLQPSVQKKDEGHDESEPATKPVTNILKRMEERRRAVEEEKSSRQSSSNSEPSSSKRNSKALPEPQTKLPVEEKDKPKAPSEEGKGLPERVPDSVSEDYDPHQTDTKQWKQLVRRSIGVDDPNVEIPTSIAVDKSKMNESDANSILDIGDGHKMVQEQDENFKFDQQIDSPETRSLAARQLEDVMGAADGDEPKKTNIQETSKQPPEQPREKGTSQTWLSPTLQNIRHPENEWMPPTLTTYGKGEHSPEDISKTKADPPSKLSNLQVSWNPQKVEQTQEDRGTKSSSALSPPVPEITVAPKEDDSSLGSMGFLFASQQKSHVLPQKAYQAMPQLNAIGFESKKQGISHSEQKNERSAPGNDLSPIPGDSAQYSTAVSNVTRGKDAATMTLKMNHTFARTEDDYYKSWILPESKTTAMKLNQIEEVGREDPPGIPFKPDTKPLATETTIVRIASMQKDGTDEIQKEVSWTPSRPKYTPSQTRRQNPDDWETWKSKLAKLETEKTTHKQKDSSEKDSIESAWVPPTRRSKKRESGLKATNVDGNDFQAKFNSSQNSNETSWLPPSRIVRLDFAGSMNSQPTGATKARSSFKDPNDRTRMPSGTDGSGSSSFSSSNSDQSSSNGDDPYVMSGVAREVPLTPSSRSRRESSHTSTDYSSSYSKNSSSEGTEALFENFKGGHPSKQNSNDDISQELENSTRVYSGDQKVFELIDDKRVYSGEQKLFERIDETSESGDGGPRNEQKNYDRTSEGAANATVQVDLDLEKGVDKDASNLDSEKSPTRPRRMMALSIVLPVVIVGTVVGVVLWLVIRNGSSSSPSAAVSPPSFPSRPSSSPIGPPPSVDELRSMIIEASPDVELRLINSNSPQSQALNWLSTNQFLASYPDQRILQRFVLASIYYSTDGRSWNQDDVWLSDIDECDWYSSETLNDVCNSQGVMDEIDLKENGLRGPIDWTSILILGSQLTVLDLAANQLSGMLSMEIRGLSQLLVLNLQDNQMSGTIPSVFGDLRGLRQLDLSNNSLDGNLPTQLASMESLQSLRLNGNQFSGTIPTELGRMTDLRQLFLNDNSFVGSVPTELCSLQLSKLEVDCDIACSCCTSCGPNGGSGGENDDLSGDPFYEVIVSEFPAGAGALNDSGSPQRNALNWLKSPFNNGILADERRLLQRYALATFFYSTVGSRWSSKDSWVSGEDECTWFTSSNEASVCDTDGNIIELSLQQNGLDGSIPPELALLSNSLEIIDLKDNNIAGSIPTEFGQFSRLVRLNLAQNDLFGVIPSEFGQMSSLERLVLFGNNLFSVVPSELGFIRGLQLLDVGDNQLTGTIPSTIGLIESLGGLSIYNNFLSGTIPSQISNLPNLQLFYADDNDLRGPIPVGFCQLDLQEFWTDCEETECTCCTTCCTDSSGCA